MKTYIILFFLVSNPAWAASQCNSLFPASITEIQILESVRKSQSYLDHRNKEWAEKRECLCCHTTLPYMLSRKLDATSAANFMRFERLARTQVENPNSRPWYASDRAGFDSRPTEAVINAQTLIMFDRKQLNPTLRPVTLKAVSQIFERIGTNGKLHWLDFSLQPFESKEGELWGNALAILTIEMAIKYGAYKPPQESYYRLKESVLSANELGLHEKSVLLWAQSQNAGLLTREQKTQYIKNLSDAQNLDGSWNQKTFLGLGSDGADVYSTSLAVIALTQLKTKGSAVKKAAEWLLREQKLSNNFGLSIPFSFWSSTSVNTNRNLNNLFASDNATAYATLALELYAESIR